MSGGAGEPVPPTGDATERCDFASCGALVSRSAAGSGGCGGCRTTVYCGAACQRADWPSHKYNVGLAYATGTGVSQSWPSALEWFSRCAAQPVPPREVWVALGDCFRFGNGVGADAVEAVRLYRVGADAGSAGAQCQLAYCLTYAVGFPAPDVHAAFAQYTAAAAEDHPNAILNLAACYSEGCGVARDAPRAMVLWRRALAHPRASPAAVSRAAFSLGAAYWNGAGGVPRDRELAARYLRESAAGGHEPAARYLRELGFA